MHSKHATSTAQDALDTLMIKYPLHPLMITSTKVTTDPLPDSPAVQDTTLPDAPTTAPAENEGWKTVEGKAMQKKRRNKKADDKGAATTANNTPTTKNGGWGKNSHQPQMNTPSAKNHSSLRTTPKNSDPPPAFSTTTRKSPEFRPDSYSAASIYLCAIFSDQVHSFLSCYTVKKRSPGP
jgi:hypothetical protein